MTYEQTIEFLFSQLPSYQRIGKAAYKNDLNNIIAFDDRLGNPHRNFKTIHVAGTNGKGSVSHMISSFLQEAGYKTGLYTSPHLIDFRERIKIGGEMISCDAVSEFISRNEEFIGSLKPSFFEMTVAMAFDHFARSKVDVAVIEVGLGGRLDSTNIIEPVLSVITNIGHDHQDILGDTIEKIAFEKAGIIKKSVPVVISETRKETAGVFIKRASGLKSEVSFADQNFTCNLQPEVDLNGERGFVVTDLNTGARYEGISPLGGDYQSKNIQAVFQAFKILGSKLELRGKNLIDGIKKVVVNTGLSGRWQILKRNPYTVCDTGHNKEGLQYVIDQIMRVQKTGLHIIIGFVNDKDLHSVLPLLPKDAMYYFTKASVPRALDEKILKNEASVYDLKGDSYEDVETAIHAAAVAASPTDMIFIGGSTFVVGDALQLF